MTLSNKAVDRRLATYGTLSPGQRNHGQLAGLTGRWHRGTVRGRLAEAGWAWELGLPGLILDPLGGPIDVHLLESPQLPAHWLRLDAFEGTGYRRVVTQVRTPAGALDAWIYVVVL